MPNVGNCIALRAKAPGQNTLKRYPNLLGTGAPHIMHTTSELQLRPSCHLLTKSSSYYFSFLNQ